MLEILISVYPKYTKLIMEGKKNFEFRPFKLKTNENIIFWIYETQPTKAIKYKMLVKPAVMSLSKGVEYGLGKENFYRNINEGKFAYEIVEIIELERLITLKEMKKLGISAPQNYLYISNYLMLRTILSQIDT